MAGDPPPPSYGTADSVSEGDGKWRPQRRHVVAVLAFLGFANIYAMRANLSVAIVEMTLGTTRLVNGTLIHTEGEFKEWSSVTQGVILGSFFYGYIITQIPGGFLAHTYGGKTVFLIGIFGTAVFTLLTPPFAKMGFVMLVLARFTEGLLEGVTYPAMHVMWSYWAPSFEKTQLATFAFSGSYFGTVLSMPISAILGQHIGWPSIFYVFGLIGLLWCWAWAKKVKDTPELDQNITTDELTLLQRDASNMHTYLIPWRQILASRPVWAIVVAHFCQNWGFYTMLTCLPRILNDLAHYDLEQAGFVSGLPYLFMGASLIVSGHVADYLRKEKGIATVRVRKQFAVIGFLSQSFFLLLASFSSSSTFLVFFMSLSIGLGGLTWAGFSVNHLDLAPQFAGHLMGLSNTFATLPGMISPVIVGFVVTHNTSAEWNVIFYSTALIYSLGALCFGSWASGEVQDWASDSAPFVGQLH